MRNNETEWEQLLQDNPHLSRGYSHELKQSVQQRIYEIKNEPANDRKAVYRIFGVLAGVIAVAVMLIMILSDGFSPLFGDDQRPTNDINENEVNHENESETEDRDHESNDDSAEDAEGRLFDIDEVEVGDQFGEFIISVVEPTDVFLDGMFVSLEGATQLSGTYEYYYNDAVYNAGDLIFYTDEASTTKLPLPEMYDGYKSNLGFILKFTGDPDLIEQFGPRGSSGKVTIEISGYSAYVAEAWGGVINPMFVERVVSIDTIPPDHPDKLNLQATETLNDFPVLDLDLAKWQDNDAWPLTEWLKAVQQTFSDGMTYDERRIPSDDRNLISRWLRQIFTEAQASELLTKYVPEADGGYMVVGGALGLVPTEELLSIEPRRYVAGEDAPIMQKKLTEAGTEVWIFDAKLQADSRIPRQTVRVELVWEEGRWKIAQFQSEWLQ